MKTNLLFALVILSLTMQAVLLYRQQYSANQVGGARQAVRDAPKESVLDVTGLPARGRANAAVVLVEFSDYECPYCGRHATSTAASIDSKFVDTGKVKRIFANNPLPIHASARMLAGAAICGGEQDRYWDMYEQLFTVKPRTKEDVTVLVAGLGIDPPRFQECLLSVRPAKRIDEDLEIAKHLGLYSTPAFAIGRTTGDGRVRIHKLVTGAQPLAVFERTINEVLSLSKS